MISKRVNEKNELDQEKHTKYQMPWTQREHINTNNYAQQASNATNRHARSIK